ncbi:hypothetical protein GCM10029992_30150 [Glycomyces albus]
MYLKSLTLKGFKSFASATTLRFEPGITCVVGPNGSGKSNVVDAIAWVLGEQGAKSLRGGKMEDVIFAGTTGRPALGRAEVTLTIDNADGAIPIDYSEVSITRRMFRSGEGEYEINGDRCRLLDVQDLLSDAGIGREMHVLVGQGKLDSYLHARPEDRRAFIEEAAGVLKHRKRKEKAIRKLDGMQGNLDRLSDLTAELRRQLKPLGRQAELARRAQTIQADLREARLRLLADDLTGLRADIAKDLADEQALRERRNVLDEEHERLSAQITELESAHAADKPRLARLQETWYRLQAVAERLRSTAQLAAERRRYLSEDAADDSPGRDPEMLETEARRIREQEIELREGIAEDSERLSSAVETREETETALAEAEQRIVGAVKAAAERRESLARLNGRVESLRSRTAAADDEIERAATALAEARSAPRPPPRPWPKPRPKARPPRPTPSSTSGWRPPPPESRPPSPRSTGSPGPNGRPTATPPTGPPARRPSRWACAARTARPPCSAAARPSRGSRLHRRAADRRTGLRGRPGRRARPPGRRRGRHRRRQRRRRDPAPSRRGRRPGVVHGGRRRHRARGSAWPPGRGRHRRRPA